MRSAECLIDVVLCIVLWMANVHVESFFGVHSGQNGTRWMDVVKVL